MNELQNFIALDCQGSVKEAAFRMGYSPKYISAIVRGRVKPARWLSVSVKATRFNDAA